MASPERKWFFQVCIARSAALRRLVWGGTRWKLMLCLLKDDFRRSENLLSSICKSGAWPFFLRRTWQSFHASAMDFDRVLVSYEEQEF